MLLGFLEMVGTGLSTIFWLILALFILVLVHELGHFLAAKAFRMRVEKFSIGFPPKIVSKKVGETEYVVGATPLGGYVKISGMVDESMDARFADTVPEPWEFRSKPVWQRIVVITAGVVFNVILAVVIFSGLKYFYGEPYVPVERIAQFEVMDSSLAFQMGMRTGDRIVAVNGREVKRDSDILNIESLMADRTSITVNRAGEEIELEAPDQFVSLLSRADGDFGVRAYYENRIGDVSPDYPAESIGMKSGDRVIQIGEKPIRFWEEMRDAIQETNGEEFDIRWTRESSTGLDTLVASVVPVAVESGGQTSYLLGVSQPIFEIEEFDAGEAIIAGARDTWTNTVGTVLMFKKLIVGEENVRDALGGPVAIAQATKQAADQSLFAFWRIVALLSVTLAIVNILPIPALDGGHLVFLIYEGIVRREPSLRVRMVAQQIGMFLLLMLMVFLIVNDFLRLS